MRIVLGVLCFVASLAATQAPLALDASAIPGDVTVPSGLYTNVVVSAIAGKTVTVGPGVTAASLSFTGSSGVPISNSNLVVQGATLGALTVADMTGGGISFTGFTCTGTVALSAMTRPAMVNISGAVITGQLRFNGAIVGDPSAKPNITVDSLRLRNAGGSTVYGVFFHATVSTIAGISFHDADIEVTGSSTLHALTFNGALTAVGEVAVGGSVTALATTSGAHAVVFSTASSFGRLLLSGAAVIARAGSGSTAEALRTAALTNTDVVVVHSTVEARAGGASASACRFDSVSDARHLRIETSACIARTHGSSAFALRVGAITNVDEVVMRHSTVEARSATSSTVYAYRFEAVSNVLKLQVATSQVTAWAKQSTVFAVFFASLSRVGEVLVDRTPVAATSDASSTVYAVHVAGQAQRVGSFTVRDLSVEASAAASSTAHALCMAGSYSLAGPVLVRNVTAAVLVKTHRAHVLVFGGLVSRVASITLERVDLRATVTTAGTSTGYDARILAFDSPVERLDALTVANSTLTGKAAGSYRAAGAHALWFQGTVSHVVTILVTDSFIDVMGKVSSAHALYVAGAMANVSAVEVVRSSVSSRVAGGSTAHAVSFKAMTGVRRLLVLDSTVRAQTSGSHSFAVRAGAVTDMDALYVLRSTVSGHSETSSTVYACRFEALERVASVRLVDSTATAWAKQSTVFAVFFASLSRVGEVLVDRTPVAATSDASSTVYAVHVAGQAQRVGSFTVRDLSVEASAAASSTAHALCMAGSYSLAGPVLVRNVTAAVLVKTHRAHVLVFGGLVSRVASITLERVDLRATVTTAGTSTGYDARILAFDSPVERLDALTVANSTLVAHSAGSHSGTGAHALWFQGTVSHVVTILVTDSFIDVMGKVSSAHALYVAGAMANVSAVEVVRSSVSSRVAGGSTAHAVSFKAMTGVRRLLVLDSTVRARTSGSHSFAVRAGAVTDMDALYVLRSTVSGHSETSSTVYACRFEALERVASVRLVDSTATAWAKQSTVFAVFFASLSRVDSVALRNLTVAATSDVSSTVYAGSVGGDFKHNGPFELLASTVAATSATGTAVALSVAGDVTNATSFIVVQAAVRAVSLGSTVKALSFDATVTGLGFVNVTDAVVTADSSAGTAGGGARSLYVEDEATIGEVFVVRSTVQANASGAGAHALYLMSTVSGMRRLLLQDSVVSASSRLLHNARAMGFGGAAAGMEAIDVLSSRIEARALSSSCYSMCFAALTDVGHLHIGDSSIVALCGGSYAFAVRTAALTDVGNITFVNVYAVADSDTSSTAYAFFFGAVTRTETFYVSRCRITATAQQSTVFALRVAALDRLRSFAVEDTPITAISRASSTVHALYIDGAVANVGTVLLQRLRIQADANASSTVRGVVVGGTVSNVGSFYFVSSVLFVRARTHTAHAASFIGAVTSVSCMFFQHLRVMAFISTAGTNSGYDARALTFEGAVGNVAHLNISDARLDVTAAGSYRGAGAHALWFKNTVSHMVTILVTDSSVDVMGKVSSAHALYVAGAMANVSAVEVVRSSVSSRVAGGSTAHAVSFKAMTGVRRLLVLDSTVRARTSGSHSFAVRAGAVTDMDALYVLRSTVSGHSETSSTVYACRFEALERVASVRLVDSTATAWAKQSTVFAVFFASLSRVGEVLVDRTPVAATSDASSTVYAVHVAGQAQRVGSFTVRDLSVEASAAASSTAHALCMAGSYSLAGPVLVRNVTAAVLVKTHRAHVLVFGGLVSRVASITLERVDLRATVTTAGTSTGYDARILAFDSPVERLDALTVANSTLVAHSAGSHSGTGAHALWFQGTVSHVVTLQVADSVLDAACRVSSAHALYVAGAMANVSAVEVVRSSVSSRVAGGSTAHAVSFKAMTGVRRLLVLDSTVRARTSGSHSFAVRAGAVTDMDALYVLRSTVSGHSETSSTVYACRFEALERVASVRLVDSTATAWAKQSTVFAVFFASLSRVGEVLVDRTPVAATSDVSSTVYAVHVAGQAQRVGSFTVRDLSVEASAAASSTAHALCMAGSYSLAGPVLVRNVTAAVLVKTHRAHVLVFGGLVSRVASITLERVDLRATVTTAGTSTGYDARILAFDSPVERLDALTVANSTLVAHSAGSHSGTGAHALWFQGTVSHVVTLQVADSVLDAACRVSSAHALYVAGAMANVSAVEVVRSSVSSRVAGGSTAHAVSFKAMTGVRRLLVLDSTVRARTSGSHSFAVRAGAVTDMDALYVLRSTVSGHSETSSTVYACRFEALERVASVRLVDSTATAWAKQSTVFAVFFASLSRVGEVLVDRTPVAATSDVSSTVYAVHVAGQAQRVGSFTVRDLSVEASAAASSTAHALCMAGSYSLAGPVLVRNVTAAVLVKTHRAHVLVFGGLVSRVASITLERVDLRATVTTAGTSTGYDARILAFDSPVERLDALTVANSTLTGKAAGSYRAAGAHALWFQGTVSHMVTILVTDSFIDVMGKVSSAHALYVAGAMANVSAVEVVRSSVSSRVAGGSTAHAVSFKAMTGVRRLLVLDSTVRARTSGSHSFAVRAGAVTDMDALYVLRSTVSGHSETSSTVYACRFEALERVASVRLVDSTATAWAKQSTVFAVFFASLSRVGSVALGNMTVAATSDVSSTVYAACVVGAVDTVASYVVQGSTVTAAARTSAVFANRFGAVSSSSLLFTHSTMTASSSTSNNVFSFRAGALTRSVVDVIDSEFAVGGATTPSVYAFYFDAAASYSSVRLSGVTLRSLSRATALLRVPTTQRDFTMRVLESRFDGTTSSVPAVPSEGIAVTLPVSLVLRCNVKGSGPTAMPSADITGRLPSLSARLTAPPCSSCSMADDCNATSTSAAVSVGGRCHCTCFGTSVNTTAPVALQCTSDEALSVLPATGTSPVEPSTLDIAALVTNVTAAPPTAATPPFTIATPAVIEVAPLVNGLPFQGTSSCPEATDSIVELPEYAQTPAPEPLQSATIAMTGTALTATGTATAVGTATPSTVTVVQSLTGSVVGTATHALFATTSQSHSALPSSTTTMTAAVSPSTTVTTSPSRTASTEPSATASGQPSSTFSMPSSTSSTLSRTAPRTATPALPPTRTATASVTARQTPSPQRTATPTYALPPTLSTTLTAARSPTQTMVPTATPGVLPTRTMTPESSATLSIVFTRSASVAPLPTGSHHITATTARTNTTTATVAPLATKTATLAFTTTKTTTPVVEPPVIIPVLASVPGAECRLDFALNTTTVVVLLVAAVDVSATSVHPLPLAADLTVEDRMVGSLAAVAAAVPRLDSDGKRNATLLTLVFTGTAVYELGLSKPAPNGTTQESHRGFGVTHLTVTAVVRALRNVEIERAAVEHNVSTAAAESLANRTRFTASATGFYTVASVWGHFEASSSRAGALTLAHGFTDRRPAASAGAIAATAAATAGLFPAPVQKVRVLAYVDVKKTGLPVTLRCPALEPTVTRGLAGARHLRALSAAAECVFSTTNYSLTCTVPALDAAGPNRTATLPFIVAGLPEFYGAPAPPVTARVHVSARNTAPFEMELTLSSPAPTPASPGQPSRPGATAGPLSSTAAPPSAPTPSPPRASASTSDKVRGVFSLTGGCDGRLNFVFATAAVFIAVLAGRLVWSVVQHHCAARDRPAPSSTDSGDFASGSVGGSDRSVISRAESYPTTHGVPMVSYLLRCHQWVALVYPDHHYAGVPHTVVFFTRVFVMYGVITGLVDGYHLLLDGGIAATVLVGFVAAIAAGAVQPLLRCLFYVHAVVDRRGEAKAVPLFGPSPQDLLSFGVARRSCIGVTKATYAGLNDIDFGHHRESSVADSDRPESICGSDHDDAHKNSAPSSVKSSVVGGTPSKEASQPISMTAASGDATAAAARREAGHWARYASPPASPEPSTMRRLSSCRDDDDGDGTGSDCSVVCVESSVGQPGTPIAVRAASADAATAYHLARDRAVTIALARKHRGAGLGTTIDPSSARSARSAAATTFDPRTCVRIRTTPYVVFAYALNAAVAIAAATAAAFISFPWCAAMTPIFWGCVGAAFAADAAVVQPVVVGLSLLYRWISLDPGSGPRSDTAPHDAADTSAHHDTSTDGTHSMSQEARTETVSSTCRAPRFVPWHGAVFDLMPIHGSWRYAGPVSYGQVGTHKTHTVVM